MPTKYSLDDLPAETIEVNGRIWQREEYDTDSFQWIRELEGSEYDWDANEVSLVGTNVPIRVVSMQFQSGEWSVEAAETAGPEYHRPGFTELISGDFSVSTESFEEAVETVMNYIERLS